MDVDDYYCCQDEVSDNESIGTSDEESEDEVQSFFKRMMAEMEQQNEGNSDDDENVDFETEMIKERDARLGTTSNDGTGDGETTSGTDDDDSRSMNSNDELLYDPTSDQADENWIKQQREPALAATTTTTNKAKGKTDATLNCPCCMTLLCMDCQRHDVYRTQYRAMFVFNSTVDFGNRLKQKTKSSKKGRQPNERAEYYYPVKCGECNTQVAVYDHNEIYHFFNVLASFA